MLRGQQGSKVTPRVKGRTSWDTMQEPMSWASWPQLHRNAPDTLDWCPEPVMSPVHPSQVPDPRPRPPPEL